MTVKAMPFNERNIPFQTEADVVARMSPVGQQRKSSVGLGMSGVGGRADIDFGPLDVCS